MAVTHWYTGRNSTTSATVVVRANSTGNVPVIANGTTLQAACDTAVNDGNALVEFTGLTPGSQYSYTVDGVAGGVLRTMPADDLPFWVALSSCWSIGSVDTLALQLVNPPTEGPQAALWAEIRTRLMGFFGLGDLVYMNVNGSVNGVSLLPIAGAGSSLTNAKDVNVRRAYYRAGRLHTGLKNLMRNVPSYILKDDHEYDPDNGCYSTEWLQREYGGTPTTTDRDDAWLAAATAWREWSIGNPEKEITAGIMGGPDYYRVHIANVEFFCTDLIHERDEISTPDGPSKRMLSALQEEKLLNDMIGSTATFKVWPSTKQFISSCGRNADGFTNLAGSTSEGYVNQLQRILANPRFPRAGTLGVTGDEHLESDLAVAEGMLGGSHAAISQISAGPATIEVITDPEDLLSYREGVRYKERDVSTLPQHGQNTYVLLRVLTDRIERYVLGSRYGLRYAGYVSTADNAVRR